MGVLEEVLLGAELGKKRSTRVVRGRQIAVER